MSAEVVTQVRPNTGRTNRATDFHECLKYFLGSSNADVTSLRVNKRF
jgi:hypothetical protein